MIVVVLGALGGILVSLLGGIDIPKIGKFPGYHTKPLLKHITIPTLVGMIAFGFIARNYIPICERAFPARWAYLIRVICLCCLLFRGGLTIVFKGKGIAVALLSIVPQTVEATTVALIAYGLFGVPIYIAYCIGYSLCCVSPCVIIPGLMGLAGKKFGVKKGIPQSVIAACTFDDIFCILGFSICESIAFDKSGTEGGSIAVTITIVIA
jgi:solute carrier family 9B (sodium/hydrogen exchanger), member 1/2